MKNYLLALLLLTTILNSCFQNKTEITSKLITAKLIKQDLLKNGQSSDFFKPYYVRSLNLIDQGNRSLLINIDPDFIKNLNLDSEEFAPDFHEKFQSFVQTESNYIRSSCDSIETIFSTESCLNTFLQRVLGVDYNAKIEVNYVIYQDNKGCFGISGSTWNYDYYVELKDGLIRVTLTQAEIE